jgi:serine phosphatase RsbU (regulator of sigma subunit)
MTLRLRVQTAAGARADYALDGSEMIVGRAPTAAIVIADARVSRQHARLVRRDDRWWVEDLGARNRTLLNGAPVRQPEPLRAGDRIEVGDAVLRVFSGAAPDAADDPATSTPRASTLGVAPHGHAADAARIWTLHEIHRALAGPLSLSELLDVILARCFDVLEPEDGLIMLRGADGALINAASRRRGPGAGEVAIPRRLVDEVVGKGQPALVLDAAFDERFAGSDSMVSSGIRSVIAAPIVDAEGTLGLITLCSRLAVRQFVPADLEMLVSLASAAALRVRNVALADALAARRVLEHELALAHDVQMAMLPRAMPAWPGLDIAARLTPARSVGGDLYDVVLDGDRLWFIVADVAGKSIAAALYMAITRALFRATVRGASGAAEIAGRMNVELARDNERMMFVTAAIGGLDLRTGALTLVDAGHTPALLADRTGVHELPSVPKNVALGVLADATYVAADVAALGSAMLVLYTDGLTEARAVDGEMFGDVRLRDTIAAAGEAPLDALVSRVVGAVERFAAGAPPEDDLTFLALRLRGLTD